MNDILTNEVNNLSEMEAPAEVVHMNGISNGHHLQQHNSQLGTEHRKSSHSESKHKNKHRDRDRDHDRERNNSSNHRQSSSKSTHKSSNRDREKHHAGSSGYKGGNDGNGPQPELSSSSSSKSKHRSKHEGSKGEGNHHHRHHHHHYHDKSKTNSSPTQGGDLETRLDSTEPLTSEENSQTQQNLSSSDAAVNSTSSHHHRHHGQNKSSSSSKDRHHHKDKVNSKPESREQSSSHSSSSRKHGNERSSKNESSKQHSSSNHDKERRNRDEHRRNKSSSSSSKSKHRHSTGSSSTSHGHSRLSTSANQQQPGCDTYDGEFLKPSVATTNINHQLQQLQNGVLYNENSTYELDRQQQIPEKYNSCNNSKDYTDNVENNVGVGVGYDTMSVYSNSKIDERSSLNISEASSCDYSLSQFKDDEPSFTIKNENCKEELHESSSKAEHSFKQYTDDYEKKLQIDEKPLVMDIENDYMDGQNEYDDDTNNDMDDEYQQNTQSLDANDDDPEYEDMPLLKRKIKTEDEDELPLLARKKLKKESKANKTAPRKDKKKKRIKEEQDDQTLTKRIKKEESNVSPTKRGKRIKQEEEEAEVWRWWEEEKRDDGVKWTTLEHKGPVFAPAYERLPRNVRFFYDGNPLELSEGTEEAATFYAKMLNHDYCTKDIFNENFFKDFRKVMTSKEREIIKDFRKCNFEEMHKYFVAESEKRKNASKEEKQAKKMENEALIKEYGVCLIDGHKEKIGNFRLEPPGLFRGRGEHPKMGMIKRRIQAEDVSINCGKDSRIPQAPPGHHWREVVHNNTVTWLASWVENIQGQVKYIMLNPSSKLKGEKDHVKYETARRLDKSIEKIRNTYRDEWKSKEMRVRQRAVALYFIDKLALRAGNEKDEDQADTVGCCSLRVEHVALHKELNGKEHVVVFDFLGKDSIRYYNEVQVERRVFKNLELFLENKKKGDDLFDRLNTQVLNEHLKELMEGLTAKVFRTYNASITLQNQLDLLTKEDMTVPEKLLAYNRANRAVAILCNHQRSVPKSHEKSMETLKEKIRLKTKAIKDCEIEYKEMKQAARNGSVKEKINADKKAKQLERLKEQLKKLELQETDRDENKTIALGTSKLNYLDPRISVAWCKKNDVPIEKIFNKTQRNKFMWAIHMADKDYRF